MIAVYGFFLFLGSIVSVEDWREKKIRNRWIMLGMIVSAFFVAWLAGNSMLGYRRAQFLGLGTYYLPWRYYPRVLLHLLLSFGAALALWIFAIWPAGDAKFFTLLSFLVVLIDPNLPGFPQVLFLLLLVNIFVPAGLVFAGETLLRSASKLPVLRGFDWPTWIRARIDTLRVRSKEEWPYRYDYLMLAVNLFGLFFLLQTGMPILTRVASGPWVSLAVFLFMGAGWKWLVAAMRNRTVGMAVSAGFLVWGLTGSLVWHWDSGERVAAALKMTVNFGLFLSLGRGLLCRLIERESLREAPASRLRQGVILSDASWQRIGSAQGLLDKLGARVSDGITEDDAVTLRGWLASEGGGADFTVYRTIPFALWIFFGALLTLSRQCNVVAVLVSDFGWVERFLKSIALRCLS